jgi:hypothetical protein
MIDSLVLTVMVIKASNLQSEEASGEISLTRNHLLPFNLFEEFNPVVNLKLNNRNDEQKQRTSVVLDTRNPIWNPAEIFHFTLPTDPADLHSVKLILYMSVPGTSHPPHDYTLFDSVLSSISRVNGKGEKHSLGLHALSLDSLTETPTIISLPLTLSNGSVSNAEVSRPSYFFPFDLLLCGVND